MNPAAGSPAIFPGFLHHPGSNRLAPLQSQRVVHPPLVLFEIIQQPAQSPTLRLGLEHVADPRFNPGVSVGQQQLPAAIRVRFQVGRSFLEEQFRPVVHVFQGVEDVQHLWRTGELLLGPVPYPGRPSTKIVIVPAQGSTPNRVAVEPQFDAKSVDSTIRAKANRVDNLSICRFPNSLVD